MTRKAINDLLPSTNYAIRVRAVSDGVASGWSTKKTFTTISDTVKPSIPTNVTWVVAGDSFHGEWNSVSTNTAGNNIAITRYEVQLQTPQVFKTVAVPANSGATKVIYDLLFEANRGLFGSPNPNVTMYVRAVDNKELKSDWSDPINAVNPAPGPVASVTAKALTDSVSLNWPAGADTDLIGYNVYAENGAKITFVNGLSYIFATTFYAAQAFDVRAVDKFNQESTATRSNSVTPISPFIADVIAPESPVFTAGSSAIVNNASGNGSVATVVWTQATPAANDLGGFEIRFKVVGDNPWTSAGRFDQGDRTAKIPLNLAYTDHYFQIRAVDRSANYSAWSNTLTLVAPVNAAPGNVTNFQATPGRDNIVYRWQPLADTDIKNYEVTLSTASDFSATPLTFMNGTSATLTVGGLSPSTTYYARVRATDTGGLSSSAWSSTVASSTTAFPQTPLSDGSAPASSPTPTVVPGIGYLFVQWTPISNADIVTYEVHLSTTSGFAPASGTKVVETAATNVILETLPGSVTPLAYGVTYYVKVIAKDRDGAAVAGSQASGAPVKVKSADSELTAANVGADPTGSANTAYLNAKAIADAAQASADAALTTNPNLIADSSFESGTVSGWSFSGFTAAPSTAQAFVGKYSLAVTSTNAVSSRTYNGGLKQFIQGTGTGKAYSGSLSVYSSAPFTAGLFMTSDGGTNRTEGPAVNVPANTWTRLTINNSPHPNGDANRYLRVFFDSIAAGQVVYFDAAQAEPGAFATSWKVSPTDLQEAANAAQAEAVRLSGIDAQTKATKALTDAKAALAAIEVGNQNLVTNGDYEDSRAVAVPQYSLDQGLVASYDTTRFRTGGRSIKMVGGTGNDAFVEKMISNPTFKAGVQYVSSEWIYITAAGGSDSTYNNRFMHYIFDGSTIANPAKQPTQTSPVAVNGVTSGSSVQQYNSFQVAQASGDSRLLNQWQRIWVTWIPQSDTDISPRLYVATNGTLYRDGFQVEEGNFPTAWKQSKNEAEAVLKAAAAADAATKLSEYNTNTVTPLSTRTTAAQVAADAAMAVSWMNSDPTFYNWTGSPSLPVGWVRAGTPVPTKDTVNVRTSNGALRWDTTADQSAYLSRGFSNFSADYVVVEVDVMLTAGTFVGSGLLVDFNGQSGQRAKVDLGLEITSPTLNRWYRVTKVLKKPTAATGNSFTALIMANWTSFVGGANNAATPNVKSIIFDKFGIRQATAEEITAYEAPANLATAKTEVTATAAADATSKANTAQTNAVNQANTNTDTKIDNISIGGTNLKQNGGWEYAENSNTGIVIVNSGNVGYRIQNKVYEGAWSYRVEPASENWGYLDVLTGPPFVKPGKTYTFSIWVNSDTTQTLSLVNYAASGAEGAAVTCTANVWTRLTLTQTLTANATNVYLSVRRPGRTVMATPFYMDALQIEDGTKATTYQPHVQDVLTVASASAEKIAAAAWQNPNQLFSDWTTTHPNGYTAFGATPTKETTIVKSSANAVRFNVTNGASDAGLNTGAINNVLPFSQYYTVEVDFYLVSGTLPGSGLLIDWNYTGGTARSQFNFVDEIPNASTGRWYKLNRVVKRPDNVSGTFSTLGGYLMANWTGLGQGVKDIIFDRYAIRASTKEEIAAYEGPATTDGKINTYNTNVVQVALNGKNKITHSTSAPGTATNVAGDTWIVVDDLTNNRIMAQYRGNGGTSWSSETIRSEFIAYLEASKISANSTFTNDLNVKSAFTLGDAATSGVIKTWNYNDANRTGFSLSSAGLVINQGLIRAPALDLTMGGSNLFKDSSFESTAGVTWAQGGQANSTITKTTEQARGLFGNKSMKVVSNAAGAFAAVNTNTGVSAVVGRSYVYSAWIYVPTGTPNVSIGPFGGGSGSVTVTAKDVWTRAVLVFTGSNTNGISLGTSATATAAGQVYYVDDVQLEEGDVVSAYSPRPDEILPGSITAGMISATGLEISNINNLQTSLNDKTTMSAVDSSYGGLKTSFNDWTGTNPTGTTKINGGAIQTDTLDASLIKANSTFTKALFVKNIFTLGDASNVGAIRSYDYVAGSTGFTLSSAGLEINKGTVRASALAISVGGGNYVQNSGFESSTLNWYTQGTSGVTWSSDNTVARTGTSSGKIVVSTLTTGDPGHFYGFRQDGFVADNGPLTASSWIRGTAGNFALVRVVRAIDGSVKYGTAQDASSLVTIAATGVWQRITVTLPAWVGAGATTGFHIRTGPGDNAAASTTWVDSVQVESGDVVTAYAPKPDEILPGTIAAPMMQANSITAQNAAIADLAVTSAKIVSLSADKFITGTLSAATITLGSGGILKTNNSNVSITDQGIFVTGGSSITASALTTGTFASGQALTVNGNMLLNGNMQVQTGGYIKSTEYTGTTFASNPSALGWYLGRDGLHIDSGAVSASALTAGTLGSSTGVINIAAGASLVLNGGYLKSNTYSGTSYNAAATAGFYLGNDGLRIAQGAVSAATLTSGEINAATISLGTSGGSGVIQSSGYVSGTSTSGFRLSSTGLEIPNGSIDARKLTLQSGTNMSHPIYSDFESDPRAYDNFGGQAVISCINMVSAKNNTGVFGTSSLGTFWNTSDRNPTLFLGRSQTDYNVPTSINETYIVSAFVWCAGSVATNVQLKFKTSNGVVTTLQSYNLPASMTPATAVRLSGSFTANANNGLVYLESSTWTANAGFNVDGVQVEPKTSNTNAPSPWTPGSSTYIDANQIRTGEIRSNYADPVTGQPAWIISMIGKASFSGAQILGNTIIGNGTADTATVLVSSNYNFGSRVGWQLSATGAIVGTEAHLVSNVTATAAADNRPALIIGEKAGYHMRMSGAADGFPGSRIVAMSNNTTQDLLVLNQGGQTITTRMQVESSTDANVNAGNIPPLRIGPSNNPHIRMGVNDMHAMLNDSTQGTMGINPTGRSIVGTMHINSQIQSSGSVPIRATSGAFGSVTGGVNIYGGSTILGKIQGVGGTAAITFTGGIVAITGNGFDNGSSFTAGNTNPIHANGMIAWGNGFRDMTLSGASTGSTATFNVNGLLVRTGSSRRYKENINPLDMSVAKKALDLQSVTFSFREDSHLYEKGRIVPGVIAEQAHDAGLGMWVNYDGEGRPDSFQYGELTAAHNMLIKDLYEQVEDKTSQVRDLEERLAALEQAVAKLVS